MALSSSRLVLADPSDAAYRLVFADEFNGTTLDSGKWLNGSPGWTMPNSLSTPSTSQVTVNNGLMTMNATRTGASTWSSGAISSYGKYNFAGGYVEAKITLPTTVGSWPAFWGLYDGWPPEADIMEYPLTTDGGTSGYANNKYSTNFHYTNTAGAAAAGAGVVTTASSLAGTTHTFAMDWTSGTKVRFLLDGVEKTSFTNAAVAQMPNMYMILDYAVGGWPGTPSTSQWAIGASDQTKVDWVHVWQKNGSGDTTSNWNVAGNGAFTTGGNWANGIAPAYGNQSAVFGRVGTNATATVSTPTWQVLGNITFDGAAGGTTAYTLGTSASRIQLATTAAGGSVVQATAASTANQAINAKVEAWSTTTLRNDMTGGQTLNFNGEVSGTGALNVTGVGTTVFNATGTYTGTATIGTAQEAATARITADNALGTGNVVIGSAGNGTTARLELAGNHRIANNIDYRGRNTATDGIRNVSGNNSIDGTISAGTGGGNYYIQSDSGTLNLTGGSTAAPGVALQASNGARMFTLQGAGNGVVSGTIQNGGGTVSLTKAGAGTWTLQGPNTYTGTTSIAGGTLRLAPAAAIATYSFDNVSGSTIVNDGTGGAAMNGTLTGGASVVGGGRFGNAVSLAGGASVNINSPVTDLSPSSAWTVSAWVKTTTAGGTILNKGNGGWASGNTLFYLGDGAGGGSGGTPSSVRYAGGFFQTSSTAPAVNDGTWHLVSYVNNAGSYSIYTDGVARTLSTGNASFANADIGSMIRLGLSTNGTVADGTINYNGLLDNVQIFGQALSPAQLLAAYQGKSVGPLPSTTVVSIASGGTLDVNGSVQPIASLSGVAGSAVTLGSGQLIVSPTADTVFAGTLSGNGGSLVKSGSAKLTLSGTTSHTGATTVTAGTLQATTDAYANLLTNAGGIDLQGGTVVLDHTGTASPVDQVKAILDAGYAANFATGQIRSTTLAANRVIGYADTDSGVVIRLTLPGDADLDGDVDFNDFIAIQTSFLAADTRYDQGNFNFDGVTDFNDFIALQTNFGQAIGAASVPVITAEEFAMVMSITSADAIPEPASLAAVGVAATLLRRRRKGR